MARRGSVEQGLLQHTLDDELTLEIMGIRQLVVDLIPNRPIWKEKPQRGRLMVIDLINEVEVVVHPKSWAVESSGDLNTIEIKNHSLMGLVIITPSMEDMVARKKVEYLAAERMIWLKTHSSLLFLLEQKGGLDSNRGGDLLKELGGVKVRSLKGLASDFIVHEARLAKSYSEREPVDLLANEEKKHYYRWLWKEMLKDHKGNGFKVIGHEVLFDALQSTTFPPETIGALKNGFGVELEANCGCQWEISIKGDWDRFNDCGDFECDGVSLVDDVVEEKESVLFLGETSLDGRFCFGFHGSAVELVENIRLTGNKRNGEVEISREISCPHCGNPELDIEWIKEDWLVEI